MIENAEISDIIPLIRDLEALGNLVLLAGESARAIFIKKPIHRVFLVTNATRVELAKLLDNIEFTKDPLFDVQSVFNKKPLFFSIYPPASITLEKWLEQDAKKRIFKSEAIYYDPIRDKFIDPFGGIAELKEKHLSIIEGSKEFLKNEPLIALKSISYAAKINIHPEPEFLEIIREIDFAPGESNAPLDKVREEINLIFTRNKISLGILLLVESGFLGKIFPEVEILKNVPHEKDFHPEGNAFEHTIECFKYLDKPSLSLSLAVLLHDVGKAYTQKSKNSKYKFPAHASIGAKIARNALTRMNYPENIISKVFNIIRFHMIPPALPNLPPHQSKPILESDFFNDLLKLYWADLSSSYNPPDNYLRTKSFYEEYLRQKRLQSQFGIIKKSKIWSKN